MELEITTAYAAGLIALGVLLVRQCYSNAIAFILSKILGSSNSAATWTLSSEMLQQSYWPYLLYTDSSQNGNVRKSVLWLSRLLPVLGVLLSLAAIMTPLGFYRSSEAQASRADFVYAPDSSVYGQTTMERSRYSLVRTCGSTPQGPPMACPYEQDNHPVLSSSGNNTAWRQTSGRTVNIPPPIRETYSSGTQNNKTISNALDIEWRLFSEETDNVHYPGFPMVVGKFRKLESLMLRTGFHVVEGLIVDTVNGGIGFRNHTVPRGFDGRVSWEEDLLFAVPETACVDTNLTLYHHQGGINQTLLDLGGLHNLSRTAPEYSFVSGRKGADLMRRAYLAAWWHNYYINSSELQWSPTFAQASRHAYGIWEVVGKNKGRAIFNLDDISINKDFGDYLFLDSNQSVLASSNKIKASNFSSINSWCSSVAEGSFAGDDNILIGCGLLRSAPLVGELRNVTYFNLQRGGNYVQHPGKSPLLVPYILEGDTGWAQNIYACATAVKATIKTVSLSYDDRHGHLTGLKVEDVKEKQYPDQDRMPLWGVEDVGSAYTLDQISLNWGIVTPDHERRANITTYRQPSIYLKGLMNDDVKTHGRRDLGKNPAGSEFASWALSAAYCKTDASRWNMDPSFDVCGDFDYRGRGDLARMVRWQNLTASAATASLVPNLLFTDIAASMVVGAKALVRDGGPIMVTQTVDRLRYRLPFAIPAIISLAAALSVVVASLVLACLRRNNLGHLRRHIQCLAPGRIYTLLAPGGSGGDFALSGREWNGKYGADMIDLYREVPLVRHKGVASDEDTGESSAASLHPATPEQAERASQEQEPGAAVGPGLSDDAREASRPATPERDVATPEREGDEPVAMLDQSAVGPSRRRLRHKTEAMTTAVKGNEDDLGWDWGERGNIVEEERSFLDLFWNDL
ncbi:hypothetical protein CDD80_2766 [Ophiocordyceps camponoti-rufipedis]|uniref:Uncharacterized protein n=1 Tax=Ophiocordyceps camponoti-rufipedis TaxID=2004952 RepID=A0A2C5Z693_9HYPO|nr:hypothetical protein CDD80_2766 [Ophiocordyceps camponoti-rufipedis]